MIAPCAKCGYKFFSTIRRDNKVVAFDHNMCLKCGHIIASHIRPLAKAKTAKEKKA